MMAMIGLILCLIQFPRVFYKPFISLFACLFNRLLGLRSKVIMSNLALCFPMLSEKERQKIKKNCIHSTVNALFDTLYVYYNQLFNRIPVKITGMDTLKSAIDSRRSVILLTAHFNTTFLTGKFIHDCLNRRVANMFREQSHPLINYIYERKQKQYFLAIRKNNIRGMLQALKQAYPVIYLFDLNDSQGKTFIPFFNIPAATKTSICKIAKIRNALVIPYACLKKSDQTYHLEFFDALKNFPSDDATADLTNISLLFENIIKQYPEQYLWTHRRFKTRPLGDKKVY